jgi:endoglucanase
MKRNLAFVLSLLFVTSATTLAQNKSTDPFEQNRKLGRGVNILGYDPIWRARDRARFQEKYFRLLKEAGFNSVRINLHPFRGMHETNQWRIPDSWFEVVDWAVKHASNAGLVTILDVHEYNAMGTAPDANKEKFLAAWRQLSTRYKASSSTVLFEILNEPNKNLTPALWNDYLKETISLIRQSNPSRTLIAGPGFWNSIDHLSELQLPENETNVIVTVHYYQPMDFTHQGASWVNRQDKLGVDWLGTEKELAAIKRDFDKVAGWAKANHRPILLGEFGAYDKAPMESRARYTASVARAAEERGWSWAYWQFDSDFILYDVRADAWVEPIRKALIPAP